MTPEKPSPAMKNDHPQVSPAAPSQVDVVERLKLAGDVYEQHGMSKLKELADDAIEEIQRLRKALEVVRDWCHESSELHQFVDAVLKGDEDES